MRIKFTAVKGTVAAMAVAALVLAGCSTKQQSGQQGSTNQQGSTKSLKISWKGSEKPGIEAAVAAFEKLNPDIKIVVTTAEPDQYQAILRTQLSAGTAADVVFVWPAKGNPATIDALVPGGYLQDLTARPWVAKYPPAIKDLTSINGKVYLMAPAVTSYGPWYNETALADTKLTPPSTWSEVLPFCQAAKKSGKVAFAIGAATLNTTQNVLYGLVPDLVYGADPNFDSKMAPGVFSNTKGWVSAMDEYSQMSHAGCFNSEPTGINQDAQNKLVATGKALGMFAIGFQLAALKTLSPGTSFRIHPFSGDDNPLTNLMAVSNAGGAAVNAKAQDKELAFKFVDWLGSAEGLTIYNDALAGTVPSIPTGKVSQDPNLVTITKYLANKQTVHFLNQRWPNARIEQAMYSGVQGMLAGTESAAEVLKAMDSEIAAK